MGKRKRKRREAASHKAALRWAFSIACIAFGLIVALGAFGLAGYAGEAVFSLTFNGLGIAAFLVPVLSIGLGLGIALEESFVSPLTLTGLLIILGCTLAFLGLASSALGGALGVYIGGTATTYFGFWGTAILLVALICVGAIIAVDILVIAKVLSRLAIGIKTTASGLRLTRQQDEGGEAYQIYGEEGAESAPEEAPQAETEPTITMFDQQRPGKPADVRIADFESTYTPPPLSLLGLDSGKPGVGDIKANANIIKRTFQNFGISIEMDEVSVGPTVTRYAIKPAEGVRLNKIVSLQNNLELALAAHPVRIEAPIPGKSLVGIEVPNASKATVGLGGIIGAPEWSASKRPLLAAVGRDITGTPHYVNISKMPHGLIAGATGSGKSVAIHALITSLLYRNGPNQMRFIMVDPKRVELTLYNGIPHLLTPVITDPKKAILSLRWAAKEMERRYNILEKERVRDIDSYHQTVVEPAKKRQSGRGELPEAMPYIIIVIDELADIMQTYPRELEAGIVRLAQMSRAVGIHLVLSTQRPSVNVITGLIKANVPTRLALQVASQIDSRTILDGAGAELLLGAGDMLYLSSDMQKPVRLQTAYISETEVKKVTDFIKKHNPGSLDALDLGQGAGGIGHEPNEAVATGMGFNAGDDMDDDLYEDAKAAVEEAGRASTSYLQRKLRIGYSRAARLMDILEAKGVIGPADGSKPREVRRAAPAAGVSLHEDAPL